MTAAVMFPTKVIEGWLDPAVAASAVAAILADPPPFRRDAEHGVASGTRRWVGDTPYVSRVVPALLDLIEPARLAAEAHLGCDVQHSPYPRSAVTVCMYEPGDFVQFHYDSNSISTLVVLCGESDHAYTCIKDDDETWAIHNSDRGLLIFDGKNNLHGSTPPAPGDPTRITVPINFYLPGDDHRPAGQDALIYGG